MQRRNAVRRSLRLAAAAFLATGSWPAIAQDGNSDAHVASASQLVDALPLANTSYQHGRGVVSWSGTIASHTDCSGFIDQLLIHDDGLGDADFRRWFGTPRPTAERYHDAIVAGRGFTRLASVADLRPGDLIAIKYLTRHDNTGHVMLAIGAAQRIEPTPPLEDGTVQWALPVIDSSESGHGISDTRHRRGAGGHDHDGLGRGVFRLYADTQGRVVGFSWSTLKVSHFVAPADEDLVLGRFVPGYRP